MLGESQLSGDVADRAVDNGSRERRACIVGLSGLSLTQEEARYLEQVGPCGIILFSRNYADNDQLRRLIDRARMAIGDDDLLVLIDQEGGRVQRLRGAGWPDLPPAAAFGALYEEDPSDGLASAELCSRWLAVSLRSVGVNTNCVPCLDVPVAGAHGVIGNRAFSTRADVVAALGGAVAFGAMAGGVVPVMKHVPGHGRAAADSHVALPVVDVDGADLAAQDFVPFIANSALPAAMTAHVTYNVIDAQRPASVSELAIEHIIRVKIGFHGLLMSDDVSMQALAGSIAARARGVIEAGSDVILHCNGVMSEMQEIAAAAPIVAADTLVRYRRCLGIVRQEPAVVDEAAARSAMLRAKEAWDRHVQAGRPPGGDREQ